MPAFSFQEALQQKLLPAITFDAIEDVLPVAEALLAAGLDVLEIPFRTSIAQEAIQLISKTFPGIYVGAGTILTVNQVQEAIDAGAQFGLSPGFNPVVCAEAKRLQFPFIPGVMTPSEIEMAFGMGFSVLKLFPAEQIGGMSFLKAMQGPYAHLPVQFIPMGGVNNQNAAEYSRQKNVLALGGSWLATTAMIGSKQYGQIKENIRIALALVK